MVSHQITLRAWSANADLPPVQINQGDILSRTVFITLVSGGQAVDLTSSTARVHFSKPDGTVVYLTASIVNAAAGIISVTLDSQCTAVPGLVKSIVQVTGPNGENLFFVGLNFQVAVVNIEDSIVSANEFTALTNALATVQDIDNRVPKTTQINGHALTGDVDLTPADVSAIAASEKGVANGIASLGADSKLAMGQTPTADTIVGGLHQIAVTMAAGWTKDGITLYKYGRIIWGLVAIKGPAVTIGTTIFKIPADAVPVRTVRISESSTSGIVISDSGTDVKAMYDNMGSMYHTVMWLSA